MTAVICYNPFAIATDTGGGTSQLAGTLIYWPSINVLAFSPATPPLLPGEETVMLQSQDISGLDEDTIIVVSIPGRGGSMWQRTFDDSSPATDVNLGGIIVPAGYDSVGSPFVLLRVGGF